MQEKLEVYNVCLFGDMTKTSVSSDQNFTFTDTYPEKKEGCVEFISEKDMKSALDMLDGHELNGRRIKLFEDEEAKAKRPNSRSGGGFRSKSRSRSPRSRTRSPR